MYKQTHKGANAFFSCWLTTIVGNALGMCCWVYVL